MRGTHAYMGSKGEDFAVAFTQQGAIDLLDDGFVIRKASREEIQAEAAKIIQLPVADKECRP